MTRGRNERYRRSIRYLVKLQNFYSSSELERETALLADNYNNQQCSESLDTLTPMDVYTGRVKAVLPKRLENLQALAAEV